MADDPDGPSDALGFPDAPRAELDRALSDLLESAQKVLSTQGRLRSLLRATQLVVEETDLVRVLRVIIEAAVELVGARYGALGVVSASGTLEQFIHVGMDEDAVAAIGHLPRGHGLLGAVIADPHPTRIDHLAADDRSSGFPDGHPAMDAFLGVPIRVRDEVFGNIYLTDPGSGRFSGEDEQLLVALAATAGVAIDNARLLDETRRRQKWSAASAEVSAALLSEGDSGALGLIADRVTALAEADIVCVVVPTADGSLVVDTARGALSGDMRGRVFAATATLAGRAWESRQPIIADDNLGDDPGAAAPIITVGPTMAIPLVSSGTVHGVLTVSRAPGRPRFGLPDMEMAADFADKAGLALELSRGRDAHARLALFEDRSRIARDLHDNVIQRLFVAGLGLQALATTVDDAARERIDSTVEALDDSIAEIRTAIFSLSGASNGSRRRGPSVRHTVIDLVSELSPLFPVPPRLVFTGPLDVMVSAELAADVSAVVREGLTNVARHARAHSVVVTLAVDHSRVVVEIADDGRGPVASAHTGGVENLSARAARWRGDFSLSPRESGGSLLRWTARVEKHQRPAPVDAGESIGPVDS